ncbi:MAG TPA: biopolymer transporter ExbD [Gemmataceae bacterium]|jgi:biopolymer transport protein ExbD|nr:biopolymer transporter ExbD [Gemmataceae bacterium]
MTVHLWSVRPAGSNFAVDGLSSDDVLDGVKEELWDPTDEVMGPNDSEWVPLDRHPVFAQAMADYEPPPPKHPEDETRLDMNPLIDVALVLLIFFILTTTYEELRKEFNPPTGEKQNKVGVTTDKDLDKITVRVTAKLEDGQTVFRVGVGGELAVVAQKDLEAKFKEFKDENHRALAMEVDPQVPWKSVVAIQDAAAGAKFTEIIRVMRPPSE